MNFLGKFPSHLLVILLQLYQKTLSPDHSWRRAFYRNGFCRFYPSCSEYSIRAIKKYGVCKGVYVSTLRVLRCNPWNKGGIDDV